MILRIVLTASLFLGLPLLLRAQDPAKEAPPAAQEEAPKPLVKRIKLGGKAASSQLIHKVQPVYPSEARDQKIQGTVRLHVILSKDGSVQKTDVVSGDPILAKAAQEAVQKWRYKPTLLNGELVEVDTTVNVVFSLVQ